MRTSYIEKLAYGFQPSPFHTNDFNWNALNSYNQPQQMGQGGGGGGFMNGLGALMLPMMLGGMGGDKPEAKPVGLGQHISNAWDTTKDIGSGVGNLASGMTLNSMADEATGLPGAVSGGWKRMGEGVKKIWNEDATGQGWKDLGAGALTGVGAPALAGLAGWGAVSGFRNPTGFGQLSAPGMGRVGNIANKGLSFMNKVPGLGRISSAISGAAGMTPGATGFMGALGKGIGGLGALGGAINSWRDTNQGTDTFGNNGGFFGLGGGALGEYGESLTKEMGNLAGGAMSGAQLGGPVGALAGMAVQAPGNVWRLGKGMWDIHTANRDAAEAEAGAQKWQDRTQLQQRLKAQMGDENWKRHVELQRAAGKHSWDPAAYKPEQLNAPVAPAPTPAPTTPKPTGPTPSAAVGGAPTEVGKIPK